MAQFTVNPNRFDPYKNFKFRVKWDGRYVAGISQVGALTRTTEVVEHREGGDPSTSHKSPGRSSYGNVQLQRGLTHDTEFLKWINKVWNFDGGEGTESSLADFRKNIIIDVFNEAAQKVLSYQLFRCWPSECQFLPQLDSNQNAVALESITLVCEGIGLDLDVAEPAEPSFTEPPT